MCTSLTPTCDGPTMDERSATASLLTLHEAAERLNVHYMTAYRWVRKGDLTAYKTGGRLRLREDDVEEFIAARRVDVATDVTDAGQTDWPRHVDRLTDLLLTGEAVTARSEVRKLISDGATAANVYVRLIAPALHRIGEVWRRGEINIAIEHRASQICLSIVSHLGTMFRSHGPARGVAVTLTPQHEDHSLASTMVADFLRAAGYAVHHLGAGVPTADLTMFLTVVPADVVCFSITQPLVPQQYVELVEACRQSRPDTVVICGGAGPGRSCCACRRGGAGRRPCRTRSTRGRSVRFSSVHVFGRLAGSQR